MDGGITGRVSSWVAGLSVGCRPISTPIGDRKTYKGQSITSWLQPFMCGIATLTFSLLGMSNGRDLHDAVNVQQANRVSVADRCLPPIGLRA